MTLDIKPLYEATSSEKRLGMARVVRDLRVLPAHPLFYPRMKCTIPAIAFTEGRILSWSSFTSPRGMEG